MFSIWVCYTFLVCGVLPGWLSGEHVRLVTWWLWVQSPVEANFLSGVFSPLTSAEACEKSSCGFGKKSCVSTGVRKPENTYASLTAMIRTALAVKVVLNPNTTNQLMCGILTLSQTTNLRPFQIERVCRQQYQIWWKWQKVLQMGRKCCGKSRNCSLRAISAFPTVFSNDLYSRHVKSRPCLGKS